MENGAEPVAAEHPVACGLERDQDLLVGIPEAAGRAFLAQYADDLEGYATNQQRLVDHSGRVAAQHPGHRGPSTA